MSNKPQYTKVSFFYLKRRKHGGNHKFGVLAIGLTTDNQIKITGSAASEQDEYIQGRDKNIALNRLAHAYHKEGRANQTKYIEASIEEASKLHFRDVAIALGLTRNTNITNFKRWSEGRSIADRIRSVFAKKTDSGFWTGFIIDTRSITLTIRDQVRRLAAEPPDAQVERLKVKQQELQTLNREIEHQITERKEDLRKISGKNLIKK